MKLVAVTACPTGIAHTYMAAESLERRARDLGHDIKVETQGSIGAENALTEEDIAAADGVIIAADAEVDRGRFRGKRRVVAGVAAGINTPGELIERVASAPVYGDDGRARPAEPAPGTATPPAERPAGGRQRSPVYKALMTGVSYMIPFVVVGGLLIAVSLSLGGEPSPDGGLVIPEGSVWQTVNAIGVVGFTLMIPILSGYIAYAIADRPGLVPGMIGGWIAANGSFYDSEAGAGFLGAIVTGFLAGYVARWLKQLHVPKAVQPIMPIIVIPIVATLVVAGVFIVVIGQPVSAAFTGLTSWLSSLEGSSVALLGLVVGAMIAFDMGGPVNKTAFLFGAGLIASGNEQVMGMAAVAICVPPLGMAVATFVRRTLFTTQEQEMGYAAGFMGLFGITEGAIPFAAAHPGVVIPANMIGSAIAAAIAGLAGVTDAVPHGGPIVAVLGAVGGVPMFFVSVLIGVTITAALTVALLTLRERRATAATGAAAATASSPEPA